MTVRELIEQLAQYNPEADVLCWATDRGGLMDDVANVIQFRGVADWTNEDKKEANTVFLNVFLNRDLDPAEDTE